MRKNTIKERLSLYLLLISHFFISCQQHSGKQFSITGLDSSTISATHSAIQEVVIFCGNPGVGKSALCNSIFGRIEFQSGVNLGKGLTTVKQTHLYEGKLYIDTPGLDDMKLREQAAKEIEQALKENNNYKIIFVATLESGRIKPADLVTVNSIFEAIKTPFGYGIIFNKVTGGVMDEIEEKLEINLSTITNQELTDRLLKYFFQQGDLLKKTHC